MQGHEVLVIILSWVEGSIPACNPRGDWLPEYTLSCFELGDVGRRRPAPLASLGKIVERIGAGVRTLEVHLVGSWATEK